MATVEDPKDFGVAHIQNEMSWNLKNRKSEKVLMRYGVSMIQSVLY